MWRDIALAAKQSIVTVMDQIMEDFKSMRCAIENSDEQYLMDTFTRARDARNHFGKLLESQKPDLGLENSMSEKPIDYIVARGGNACGDLRVR